jgi:dGTPase
MPCTRQELEQREKQTLAPYAQFSSESRGRRYQEDPPEWRTEYQRDRDRVIHSRAFRRLEYKTQVFLNGSGDHLRTRLTHTMEVAAISRNIARALRINEDLTEAISLAHDLGHPAFGHKGESVLAKLMRNEGGFEHNRHSLRIVEELEQKYPSFPGLNLTWEVREGLIKHYSAHDHPSKHQGFNAKSSSLEAQVANLADEIAYTSHDLDDGLDAGLLDERKLCQSVRIWRGASQTVRRRYGNPGEESRRYFIIRCIIDDQVRDLVTFSEKRILGAKVKSADEVRLQAKPLVAFSPERRAHNREVRAYLYENLYFNTRIHNANLAAVKMLEDLFDYYLKHPNEIGAQCRRRADEIGWRRSVCDYLAGMTDRYAFQQHARLFRKGEV